MKTKMLLAIPAYNCEAQVVRVLNQLSNIYQDFICEVIVIDNRSTDLTVVNAINKAKTIAGYKVSILKNTENYNLGGTHKVAFKYCMENSYDGVIILHGDDQGAIIDFFDLLQSGRYKEFDCVLGTRFEKTSKIVGYSKIRIFGNYVFNLLYSLVVGHLVTDMGSGLNLYNKSIIEAGFYKRMPDDLTFNNCMLLATFAYNLKVSFEPISWREEDQISNAKLYKQARMLIKYLITYCLKRKDFFNKDFRSNKNFEYHSEKIYSTL